MLGKIASAGQNGQFRTPRHIIQLMVELTAPAPKDVICDPACGTAGFLVAAGEYLRERHPNLLHRKAEREHFHHGMFHGFDFDNTMLRTIAGRPLATSQDFVNWICGDRVDPVYLMEALRASREPLRGLSSGSTHKTIYMRVVEQFRIVVPPIDGQREFVRRIRAIKRLQESMKQSLDQLDALFASLQHRAFRGEL
jgi:hypothetical protein